MFITVAFWNVNKGPVQELVSELAREHAVDILLLAECGIPGTVLHQQLNRGTKSKFSRVVGPTHRFEIFTRFPAKWLRPVSDGDGLSLSHLRHPLFGNLLLGITHLPSKLRYDDYDLSSIASGLARDIERTEARIGHDHTVIVGDFNMNPFESGVSAAEGFHAVMDRRTAARKGRILRGKFRPFFYNPMWSRLGDGYGEPPGTYYYDTGRQINYYWNSFDQVLLRPSLLGRFRNEDLLVITEIGEVSLVTNNGRPDKVGASDHLPIIFRLYSQKEETKDGQR